MLKMRLYVDGKWLCELNNYPDNKKKLPHTHFHIYHTFGFGIRVIILTNTLK